MFKVFYQGFAYYCVIDPCLNWHAIITKYLKRNKIFMFGILQMLKIKSCFIVIFFIVYTIWFLNLRIYVDALTGMIWICSRFHKSRQFVNTQHPSYQVDFFDLVSWWKCVRKVHPELWIKTRFKFCAMKEQMMVDVKSLTSLTAYQSKNLDRWLLLAGCSLCMQALRFHLLQRKVIFSKTDIPLRASLFLTDLD